MMTGAGPHVAVAIERATQFQLKPVRLRALLGGGAAVLIGAAFVAWFSYSAGFASGRPQGEVAAHIIAAATAAGPSAATDWASLGATRVEIGDDRIAIESLVS
jgi:hypothetical protein